MSLKLKIVNFLTIKRNSITWNVLIGLIMFGAYFVGSLDFQLIEHDKITSKLLIVGTTLGIMSGLLLVIPVLSQRYVFKVFGPEKSIINIIIIVILSILAIVAIIIGTIAYINK